MGIVLQGSGNPMAVMGSSPTIKPVVYRAWDVHATWFDMSSSRRVYDWTNLDTAMNAAAAAGGKLIYTLALSPQWATGNTTDTNCHKVNYTGSCYPLLDNTYVAEFVTDLLNHATANGTPIWALELGNESNSCENGLTTCDSTAHIATVDVYWTGTAAQHAQMISVAATAARAVQPNIVLISPGIASLFNNGCPDGVQSGQAWINKWLASYTGPRLDYIGFHGYTTPSTPEQVDIFTTGIASCSNVNGTPLFDTEGSWGPDSTSGLTDQQKADFLARWFLLQFARNIRAAWYSYANSSTNGWGTLCQSFNSSTCNDSLPARIAYGEIYKWLADATPAGPCSQNGTVWTCAHTKASGYKSLAVWDTGGTSTYTFPGGYSQYRDLTGAITPLSGATVSIGNTPILLEAIPRNGAGH